MINRYRITVVVGIVFNLALFRLDLNETPARFLIGMMVGITAATVAEWIETIQKWWNWKNQTSDHP